MSGIHRQWLPRRREDYQELITLAPYLLILGIVLVLVIDLLWPRAVWLSWPGVVLFLLLTVLIFRDDIQQLDLPGVRESFGDELEEIRAEVRLAVEVMNHHDGIRSPTHETTSQDGEDHRFDGRDELYEQLVQNPMLGLAKLRLQLTADGIHGSDGEYPDDMTTGHPTELLSHSLRQAGRRVLDVCDRAIEQEAIHSQNGIDLIDIGLEVTAAISRSRYDQPLRSRETYWQGMRMEIRDDEELPDTIYALRRVESGEPGETVRTFSLDSPDRVVLSTQTLDPDDYLITTDGQPVAFERGGPEVGADVESSQFTVKRQQFDAEFDSGWALTKGEKSMDTLVIESNRDRYPVWATTDGCEPDHLENVFQKNDSFVETARFDDRTIAILECGETTPLTVDFTDIHPGDHEFEFIVPDANVRTTEGFAVQTF